MVTKLKLGAALMAIGCVLGTAGAALAQTPLTPVANFRQSVTDAKVAELCAIPSVYARVDLQSQGEIDNTTVDGKTFEAEFTFTSGLLATVTDMTGGGTPDQYRDTPGFEAVLVKVNNVYSLFCTINAATVTVNALPDGNRSTIGTVSVYWAPPLCPSTPAAVNGLAASINTLSNPNRSSGFILQRLGGNTEQLACGFGQNAVLRCDERPLSSITNNQFNLHCVPVGHVFAGAPATNHVDFVPGPAAAGDGPPAAAAISLLQASQYCTSTSGGTSTKYTSCMTLFGF